MEQFSQDLGDLEHLRSNTTQAARLYADSGLSEGSFQARLHEAYKTTLKRRGRIRKTSDSAGGRKNLAPYFFAVLRELLGMKADESPNPQ